MSNNKTKEITNSMIGCCRKKHRTASSAEVEESRFKLEFLSSITDQLLIEILIRLPSNIIYEPFRYKAVCKHWYYLISTNYFISRFINHHHIQKNEAQDSFTLVFQYTVGGSTPTASGVLDPVQVMSNHPVLSKSYRKQYVNLDFLSRFKWSKAKGRRMKKITDHVKKEPVHVQTSCHDLLLCARFATYYVVNLLTRQWVVLPPAPSLDCGSTGNRYPKPGLLCYYDIRSEGDGWYRFKVILVSNPHETNSSLFDIRIFCSESGQWTKLVVDWYPFTEHSQFTTTRMIAHDGLLHWINGLALISLDLFNGDPDLRISRMINLPDEAARWPSFMLGVSQGHLRVALRCCEVATDPALHVWELQDYDKGLWRLEHRVSLFQSSLQRHYHYFGLMDFHPYKRDVLFVHVRKHVYHFNMQTGRFERYFKLKVDKACSSTLLSRAVVLLHQLFPTPLSYSLPRPPDGPYNTMLFPSPNLPN